MANIFTYRPKLQYVYDKIEVIRNVLVKEEYDQIVEYLPSLNTDVIEDFIDASQKFEDLFEVIKEKVSQNNISYNKTIPGSFYTVLENFDGGHDFIKTNTLTVELLDKLRKEPIFSEIIYNIDNEDKGINGNIYSESYKALKKVRNLLKYYQLCLDKTLYLWYNVEEDEDIDLQIREGVLLNMEQYLENMQKKRDSINQCDDELYQKSDYNISYLDKILSMTNNSFYVTNQVTGILNTAIYEYSDLIDDEVIEEYNELVKQRGSRLLENSQLQDQDIRVMLYSSFKKHKQDMDQLEMKSAGAFSPDSIYTKMNDYGRASKHYHDICANTITSLKTIRDGNGYGYINSLVDGLNYMSDGYINQSVQTSNYMTSFQTYFSQLTNSLFKKNDARNLFNYFDKIAAKSAY